MTKKLMVSAAIGALMVSSALAQSPSTQPNAGSTPPAASQPMSGSGAAAGSATFVGSQKPDQWVASKFEGTDVLGSDNQKIGDISDILFDKAGKVEAYIVSVGGFLGMGAKEVALAPAAFEVVPGENGGAPKLKTSMTKDQLTNAQAFARYDTPRPAATTGTGSRSNSGMGSTSPAGSSAPSNR